MLSTYTGSAHLDGPSALYKPTLVLNEQHLYGSKRLGVHKANITIFEDEVINPPANTYWEATGTPNAVYNTPTANVGLLARGKVRYEISDHLGNVRSVITDRRLEYDLDANTIPDNFTADVVSAQDYYPFGMQMPGRQYANVAFANDYRYGFNGQERDDEVYGAGNSTTAEFWQYDARLGRRWNPDPIRVEWESQYATFRNNPEFYNDPNGDCSDCPDKDNYEGREHVSSNGNNFVYSNEIWTPGGEYQAFQSLQQRGMTTANTYFDFYAGKYGYDPTREDWEERAWVRNSKESYKLGNTLVWQNLYNNDVVDEFMWHYAYGEGAEYELTLDEFKSGVGARLGNQLIRIQHFEEGRAAIKKAVDRSAQTKGSVQESVSIETAVYAVHAGTLGNYTMKITGNIVAVGGYWTFVGNIEILDYWDFDPANRNPGDEANVATARENLWGQPFKITGNFNVTQKMTDSELSIYNGANNDNIISNYHKIQNFKQQIQEYFER